MTTREITLLFHKKKSENLFLEMMQCLNMANYWPPPASGRGARWWRRCGHHAHVYEGSERDGMEWMCSRRLPCDLLWVPMLMPWMQSEQAMMPVATQRAVILIKGREHASSALMRISLIGSWSFEFFLCFVEENSSSIPSKKFPPLLFFMCLDWSFPLLIIFISLREFDHMGCATCSIYCVVLMKKKGVTWWLLLE